MAKAKFVMADAVDQLGEIRALKSKLASKEKELVSDIKENGEEGTTYHGTLHDVTITPSKKTVIDIPAVFKKLKQKAFLEIATVTKKALSRKLSDEEIDKVTSIEDGTPTVRTKARKAVASEEELAEVQDRVRQIIIL